MNTKLGDVKGRENEEIRTRFWRAAFRDWFHETIAVHDTNSVDEWVENRARELSEAADDHVGPL